jgi:2'-hydroxyisoflavone reductase
MDILILGGTVFLGIALVDSAQKRGHNLTLFNRGKSRPEAFPEVEQIHGDRRSNLDLLAVRTWDAVIDTSGYEPAVVQASAQALKDAAGQYVFISSISVYSDFRQVGIDEDYPIAQLPEGADPNAPFNVEYYGPLKALCEKAAENAVPGRVLIIRPGLIVGPYDPSDRFTYWPFRVAQGGEVLTPDRPSYRTQFIDVRDLADWTIRMMEEKAAGVFNATGPALPLPLGDLLETCRNVSGSDAQFTWVDEAFLLSQSVQPWMELPLWIPESDPESAGMNQTSVQKALQAGLTFRALEETVKDTLTWADTRPADHSWRAGISREKEMQILRKYHR